MDETINIKIGIGLILNADALNTIRELELKVASATNNWRGLQQPPHITLKRPFQVVSPSTITKLVELVNHQAALTPRLVITYNGINHFGEDVLYAQIKKDDQLRVLYSDITKAVEAIVPNAIGHGTSEKEMVFHTTIALGLSSAEYKIAHKCVQAISPSKSQFTTVVDSMGLFLSNDGIHWDIVHQSNLKP
jgi:2'-5' RNA ligase